MDEEKGRSDIIGGEARNRHGLREKIGKAQGGVHFDVHKMTIPSSNY